MLRTYKMKELNYLQELIKEGPLSWAVIRATEYEVLSDIKMKKPILDIACGNGSFSQILFKRKNEVECAIDILDKEVRQARNRKIYKRALVADAAKLPFKGSSFATVFSNGSFEHMDEIDKVLLEASRVLKMGGHLIITVPASSFSRNLLGFTILQKLGFSKLANLYSVLLNRSFAHKNLWNDKTWKNRLKKAGLELNYVKKYNFKYTVWLHEVLLITAISSIIFKKISGRFFLLPKLRKVTSPLIYSLLNPVFELSKRKNSSSSMLLIAVKK